MQNSEFEVLPKGTSLGPYIIEEMVGHGSMGLVYKVSKEGVFFAAKVLIAKSVENVSRFRKEAAAVSRLDSPNLVKIVDVGEARGEPYMIMEYVTGETLDKIVSRGPVDNRQALHIFKSMSQALSEIHRFRMVHRDIKPENAMLTEDGDVKLLDLGLVEDTEGLNSVDAQSDQAGTFLYSSPEQSGIVKRPVDSRSDLYSLGVMMFEILTGKPPFQSKDIAQLIQMHASHLAPSIVEIDPEASPVLSAIVEKLLSKEPDDRYQSAKGLLNDLERYVELSKSLRDGHEIHLGTVDHGAMTTDVPLVGRDTEMDRLGEVWHGTKDRTGGVVIVEGEGGSGKSRLIQDALLRIRKDSEMIFKGKCQKIQNGIPFFPFREGFDDLLLKNEKKDNSESILNGIRAAAKGDGGVVRILSKSLEKVFSDVESAEVDQQVFNEQFSDFLVRLTLNVGPLVFVIDDIQWADDATINLLEVLAKKSRKSSILILMSARNDKDSIDRLKVVKERLGQALIENTDLGPLAPESVGALAESLLGNGKIEEDVCQKIHSAANGNPFAVGEIVRSLLSSGNFQLESGFWKLNAEGLENLELSKDVFQLVLSRIESLSESVRQILSYASVIGNTFSLDLLSQVSQISVSDINISVETAVTHSLVERIDETRVRFVHDRVRESMISSISDEDYRKLNTALALVLDRDEQTDTEKIFDLARYYASGDIDSHRERVLATSKRAGFLAFQNFSYEQAYDLMALSYECGKTLKIPAEQMIPVTIQLVQVCILSVRLEKAHRLIDELMTVVNADQRAEALYLRTKALYAQGYFNEAWEAAKDSIEAAVNIKYPKYLLGKLSLFNRYLFKANMLAFTGIGYGSLSKLPDDHPRRKRYQLIVDILEESFKIVAIYKGSPVDAMVVLYLMQTYSHAFGDADPKAKAHVFEATFWGSFAFAPLVQTFLDRSRSIIDRLNNPKATAFYLMQENWAIEYSGDPVKAEKKIEIAYPLCRRYLEAFHTATIAICKLLNFQYRGLSQEVLENATEVLRDSDNAKQWTHVVNARLSVYESFVKLGQPAEALRVLKENMQLVETYTKDTKITGSMWATSRLAAMKDLDETGVDVDLLIRYFLGFKFQVYYAQQGLVAIAHIRLSQFTSAYGTNEEIRTRRLLGKALRKIYKDVYAPLFRCHYFIVKAGYYRVIGRFDKALRWLDHAAKMVRPTESATGMGDIFRERARIYLSLGDKYAFEANLLLVIRLFKRHGWVEELAQVEKEFGISASSFSGGGNVSANSRTAVASRTQVAMQQTRVGGSSAGDREFSIDGRIVNALLQVSSVSTKTSNPVEQSDLILDEVIKLFGAERGFVFMKSTWDKPKEEDAPEIKIVGGDINPS